MQTLSPLPIGGTWSLERPTAVDKADYRCFYRRRRLVGWVTGGGVVFAVWRYRRRLERHYDGEAMAN